MWPLDMLQEAEEGHTGSAILSTSALDCAVCHRRAPAALNPGKISSEIIQ